MISDFHMHSKFSGDSEADPDEIISTAISKGMNCICFTDHLDLDYPEPDCDFDLDVDSYYDNINILRENYSDRLDIRIGIETGLEPHLAKRLDEKINRHDFDFIIGSSHIVNGMDPYYKSFFDTRTNKEAYTEYFTSILECLETCHNFDVYGHLDYVIRYTPYKDQKFYYSDYSDMIDEILKRLIASGKGIEINTGGYAAGLNAPNPSPDIIKRYKELGGEIITVGSDAHTTDRIGADFDKAEAVLKECGFKYYTVFKNRKPQFIPL